MQTDRAKLLGNNDVAAQIHLLLTCSSESVSPDLPNLYNVRITHRNFNNGVNSNVETEQQDLLTLLYLVSAVMQQKSVFNSTPYMHRRPIRAIMTTMCSKGYF